MRISLISVFTLIFFIYGKSSPALNDSKELLEVAAYVYTSKGLYRESNEILEKTLKESEQKNDMLAAAQYSNNLGVNYLALKKYDKAKQYFENSYRIFKELPNGNDNYCTLNNISVLQLFEGKPEVALEGLKKAFNEYNANTNVRWSPIFRYNLGEYYLQTNKKDSAMEYFINDSDCCEPGLNFKPAYANYRLCYLISEENIDYCKSLQPVASTKDSSFFSMLTFYNSIQYKMDSIKAAGNMEAAYDLSVQKANLKEQIVKHINETEYQNAIASFNAQQTKAELMKKIFGGIGVFLGGVFLILIFVSIKQGKGVQSILNLF